MDNVVRLPRDWLGPVEDLVPFGPAADLTPDAHQPDAGDASPMAPVPSAQSFWTQDAASLHAALDAGPARAPDIDVPARGAESIPVLGPTPRGAFSRPGVRHWRGLLTSVAALLVLAAVLLMKSAATGINPATARLDAPVSPPAEAQSASHLAHGLAAQAARASADRAATAPRGHRAAAATRPRRHARGRHPATAATTYVSTRAARSSVVTGSSYHPATASATPAATYVTQPQAGSESASTAASTSSSTASTSSSAPGPTGPGAPFGPGHTG